MLGHYSSAAGLQAAAQGVAPIPLARAAAAGSSMRPPVRPPGRPLPHAPTRPRSTLATATATAYKPARGGGGGNEGDDAPLPPFDPAVGGALRVGLADMGLPAPSPDSAAAAAAGPPAPPYAPPTALTTTPKRLRLDSFLAARFPALSRARLAAAVRAGAVMINGAPAPRPGAALRVGDTLSLAPLPPLPPLTAEPEDLPLAIVYEDAHLIVVNKAAGVVVHPAPGALTGTLVAGLLFHVQKEVAAAGGPGELPTSPAVVMVGQAAGTEEGEDEEGEEEEEDGEDGEAEDGEGEEVPSRRGPPSFARPVALLDAAASPPGTNPPSAVASLRPGIVHRLDKGTSGLLVVAKSGAAHEALADAFQARSVRRVYTSLAIGVPDPPGGTVRTNVGRDPADRTRMASFPYGGVKGRRAVSDYRVVEVLGGGAASRVEWRLRTGRTHQIRVHAKQIGHPLVGDGTYGGGGSGAVAALAARSVGKAGSSGRRGGGPALAAARARAGAALRALDGGGEAGEPAAAGKRPALHARSLGFTHPVTGEAVDFEVEAPADFQAAAEELRGL